MIALLDTETTGTDETKHELVEVAVVRYDEEYGVIDCASWVLGGLNNDAERINHIAPKLRERHGRTIETVTHELLGMLEGCRAIVAHHAAFDRKWLPRLEQRWVCSQKHVEWPAEQGRDVSLEKLALAHGVGVLPGHRAIYDAFVIARVFDAVRAHDKENGRFNVKWLIDRALRPKALYRAVVTYQSNQLAKDAGFRWDADRKSWCREMAVEDAPALVRLVRFGIQKLEDVP